MNKSVYLVALLIVFVSCANPSENRKSVDSQSSEYMLLSTAWYQLSAERKALYYQAFNVAKMRIDEIAQTESTLPSAVVLDIDETVLDNSAYQGWCVTVDSMFSKKTWNNWVVQANADALEGAVDFTNYAVEKGIAVIYISNRHVSEMEKTVLNLQEKGFPNAAAEFVFLKEETSDKTARRAVVSEKYNIAMLIGDNLGDFDHLYDDRSEGHAHKVLEEQKDLFGTRFIMLPNPMYGKWERPYQKLEGNYVDNLKKKLKVFQLK